MTRTTILIGYVIFVQASPNIITDVINFPNHASFTELVVPNTSLTAFLLLALITMVEAGGLTRYIEYWRLIEPLEDNFIMIYD